MRVSRRDCVRSVVALWLLVACSAASGQGVCGDCDGDGQITITDALVAAQHGAGLIVLVPPQLDDCDVDLTATVNVLDALRLAQTAAGLPGMLLCGSNQPPVFAFEYLPLTDEVLVPIYYTVQDREAHPANVTMEYSLDGGTTWLAMSPQAGISLPSQTTGVTTSPSGERQLFVWDTWSDLPGLSAAIDLRGFAEDATIGPTATSTFALTNGAVMQTHVAECIPLRYRWPDMATVTLLSGIKNVSAGSITLVWGVGTACQSQYQLDGATFDSGVGGICTQPVVNIDILPGEMHEWTEMHEAAQYYMPPGVHDIRTYMWPYSGAVFSTPVDIEVF